MRPRFIVVFRMAHGLSLTCMESRIVQFWPRLMATLDEHETVKLVNTQDAQPSSYITHQSATSSLTETSVQAVIKGRNDNGRMHTVIAATTSKGHRMSIAKMVAPNIR